jgi:hypothetical protein
LGQLVRSDKLIDDAARDLTALATRPALRERVMAEIAAAPQRQASWWWVPTVAAATGVAIGTWLLMPARLADEGASTTITQHEVARDAPYTSATGPVIGRLADAVIPAPVEVPRNTSARTTTRGATPALTAAAFVWTDTPVAEITMLPPLAGPPPIVIEPITWDQMMIAPLEVELIEVKALVIEPLGSTPGGV